MDLRLLVEVPGASPNADEHIHIKGRTWRLEKDILQRTKDPEQIRPFTCISYVWGSGRRSNPFYPTKEMSDRTLAALELAMQISDATAFWIDAFCIPPYHPAKRATLESMGFIYSLATEVIVSLSSSTGQVLKRMGRLEAIDDESLEILERDTWVESVWTYQEVINSRKLRFVARNQLAEWFGIWSGPWTRETNVDGRNFFNSLGYSLQKYRARHHIKDLDVFVKFPRLDALEETLSDWELSNYAERPALQVMSNMDRRKAAITKYRFYSMIGSLTSIPSERASEGKFSELAEAFMRICEEKNDYSFIYSSAPRDNSGWRPLPGYLPSLISWHCFGEGQQGFHNESGFVLKDVLYLEQSSNLGGKELDYLLSIVQQLGDEKNEDKDETVSTKLFTIIKRMGFTGERSYIMTELGVFFPQFPLPLQEASLAIIVATHVKWTFGAPGFATAISNGHVVCIPGVFVGEVSGKDPRIQDYLFPHSNERARI